jgi:tetratricopeptide (TPR) repeat protein
MKRSLIFFLLILFLLPFFSQAQQSYEDSLNKVISESKDEADVSRAYNALAYEYTRKDPAKARYYLSAAIAAAKKVNNPRRLSNAYSQLIYVLYDGGKPDSAEYYLNLVKDLVNGAPESEKDALNSNYNTVAAMFYKKTGSYQKAIPFFENAISLYKKIGA